MSKIKYESGVVWADDAEITPVPRNVKDGCNYATLVEMITNHPAFSDDFVITPCFIHFLYAEEALMFQLTFTGY